MKCYMLHSTSSSRVTIVYHANASICRVLLELESELGNVCIFDACALGNRRSNGGVIWLHVLLSAVLRLLCLKLVDARFGLPFCVYVFCCVFTCVCVYVCK